MTDTPKQQPSETRFLADWSGKEWDLLLRCTEPRAFRAGETVINVGDHDRAFYIVASGRLDIMIYSDLNPAPVLVQSCGAGSMFGEQAFLDGRPRSATVKAAEDGRLARFSFEAFEVFSRENPDLARKMLFDLARLLSLRLRRANQMLGSGGL